MQMPAMLRGFGLVFGAGGRGLQIQTMGLWGEVAAVRGNEMHASRCQQLEACLTPHRNMVGDRLYTHMNRARHHVQTIQGRLS